MNAGRCLGRSGWSSRTRRATVIGAWSLSTRREDSSGSPCTRSPCHSRTRAQPASATKQWSMAAPVRVPSCQQV
eukprot:3776314-Pyramimonas_sp.AAC.1